MADIRGGSAVLISEYQDSDFSTEHLGIICSIAVRFDVFVTNQV